MLDTEPTTPTAAAAGTEPTTPAAAAAGTATNEPTDTTGTTAGAAPPRRRRRAAVRPAGPPAVNAELTGEPATTSEGPADAARAVRTPVATAAEVPAEKAAPAKRARKRATKKTAVSADTSTEAATAVDEPAAAMTAAPSEPPAEPDTAPAEAPGEPAPKRGRRAAAPPAVLFQPPQPTAAPAVTGSGEAEPADAETDLEDDESGESSSRRRRRGGRGRRGRIRSADDDGGEGGEDTGTAEAASAQTDADGLNADTGDNGEDESEEGTSRRRRRRRRRSSGDEDADETPSDDPLVTVTRVREPRSRRGRDRTDEDDDGVRAIKGSTRLEAKKQRRREGREAGRRRAPVLTEAEFLARREAVNRTMLVRQAGDRTQIAVLEDDILVEHYVSTASSAGFVGNVYLGRVQNVLPSMEAAFVDIGRGRNGVLYAGEVNWDAAGLEGQPRRIESALKSGDPVLVQVTKDPIGHKGARLSSQISLAGRYLVLVPNGSMTGISRKLPENERSRLKSILKKVLPENAGVIVRTAAEGASEEELSRDVARLTAQWEDIEKKSAKGSSAPELLYGEPDMTIRVVRDIFNEDFAALHVSGDDAWDMLEPYISYVAPDLRDRMSRWTAEQDLFAAHRVDEQLAKALDRKVWLPSGGYLIIDRTEAMIVVDVNTGKFTGAGGNLEETVTKNNLEAAEEIVRQLRLRDLGGIIVIDFIDMVLESNRDLVLRRLLECLGRDRTKHQVAEVTSLGLVQMTRKRVGQGLHEAFSTTCDHCNGRGYHISTEPVEQKQQEMTRAKSAKSGKSAKAAKPGDGDKQRAEKPVKSSRTAASRRVSGVADGADRSAAAAGAAILPVADVVAVENPVAVEDPVAVGLPVEPTAVPARSPRRRRAASSPQTTVS